MAVRLSPTERIAAFLVKAGLSAHEAVELLAAHDAQVRAKAWDEGYGAGEEHTKTWVREGDPTYGQNPYRAEATR